MTRRINRQPDIIYFVVHDIGKHTSNYGVPVATPNLRAFGETGAVFENAFCASPPCSPSRGVAMSGRYAHCNGLMGLVNKGWTMPRSVRTIVDELNDFGYETAHFGFQHERAAECDNRYQVQGDLNRFVEQTVDHALRYLNEHRNGEKPFYVNIGVQEAHGSLWVPGGGYFKERSGVYGIDPPDQVHVPKDFPDNAQTRDYLGRFQACIRHMDRHFGRFIREIDRLGYGANTLVVFTTDHGMYGSRAKGTLYDRGVEIATLMRFPGVIQPQTQIKHLISNLDFLPTFLELCGAPIPSYAQGKSFRPMFSGKSYQPHEAIFTERNDHEIYDPMRAVRTRQWHYIRNLDPQAKRYLLPQEILELKDAGLRDSWPNSLIETGSPGEKALFPARPAEELYDVEKDPHEFVNLAGNPDHCGVLNDLAARCDRWMQETNDPALQGPISQPDNSPGNH